MSSNERSIVRDMSMLLDNVYVGRSGDGDTAGAGAGWQILRPFLEIRRGLGAKMEFIKKDSNMYMGKFQIKVVYVQHTTTQRCRHVTMEQGFGQTRSGPEGLRS
jgi:hypothetical protein